MLFHTKNIPGSHVVLKYEQDRPFTDEAITEAAPEEAPVVVEESTSQKSTSKNRVGAMFDFLTFSDV